MRDEKIREKIRIKNQGNLSSYPALTRCSMQLIFDIGISICDSAIVHEAIVMLSKDSMSVEGSPIMGSAIHPAA
jgi:hypothetical protein